MVVILAERAKPSLVPRPHLPIKSARAREDGLDDRPSYLQTVGILINCCVTILHAAVTYSKYACRWYIHMLRLCIWCGYDGTYFS